jgi:hypothetical protein
MRNPGPMKLVVQVAHGTVYVYRESEKHFKRVESQRKCSRRMKAKDLDFECDLSMYENCHWVFDLNKTHKKRKTKKKS